MKKYLIVICTVFASVFSVKTIAQIPGYLYGMTNNQQTSWGTVFSFDPLNNKYVNKILLNLTPDGGFPQGSLMQATNDTLYGLINQGGANNLGVIFSVDPVSGVFSKLLDLNTASGTHPIGNLMQASNGYLYGMTNEGGAYNDGVLFRYDIAKNQDSVCVNFSDTNGASPNGSMIQASNGLLYGMTTHGGDTTNGLVFSYNTVTNKYTVVYRFPGSIGYPFGSLVEGYDNLLYGMTELAFGSGGVLFSLNPVTNKIKFMHVFSAGTGNLPMGCTLLQSRDSLLYGTTTKGGTNGLGVIFSYRIRDSVYKALSSFNDSNGSKPIGSLIQANNNALYGMTPYGGYNEYGVIYRYDTGAISDSVVLHFDFLKGFNPMGDLLEIMTASLTKSDTGNKCYGETNGWAVIHVRGGHYPLTYSWSNGATTDSVYGLKAGNYTGSVKDQKGITYTYTFTIKEPPQLKDSIALHTNVSCYGGNNGAITINVKGGVKPYNYLWSPGLQTGATINNLTIGSYSLTVTDSNKCITPITVGITQPAVLKDTIVSSKNVLCNGNSTGIITTYVHGGTKPYLYTWSGGAGTDSVAKNITTGIYTCSVTDSNKCSTSIIDTITSPMAIKVVTSYTPTPCNKNTGRVGVSVSGGVVPYSYMWSNGFTSALDTALASKLYTCVITDSNSCVYNASVFLPNVGGPVDSIYFNTNEKCYGDSAAVVRVKVKGGTLPYTFSWAPYGGKDTVASGLAAGTYTMSTTDNIGCTGTATITITQPPLLRDSIVSFSNVSCFNGNNGSITIGTKGGTLPYNYSWSAGLGTLSVVSNLVVGTYTCIITDLNNCITPTSTQTITITSPTTLAVDTSSTPTNCGTSKGTVTAIPSGGISPYTYSWSPVSGTNALLINLPGGTYSCTVTDFNKCVNNIYVSVVDTGGPRDTIIANSSINCYGDKTGSAIVDILKGKAPYTYSWSSSLGTNGFAINLGAGTYTCTVTDATSCKGVASITFTQPTQLTSVINTIGVCHSVSNGGSAIINVSGGVPPYSYLWSTNSTNDSIANIGPGSYVCSVTDSNNCKITPTCNIVAAAVLQDSIVAHPASCAGCNNGWVQVYPYGGIPQGDSIYYLYVWDTIINASSIHNVDTGVYHVCITTNYCPNETLCDSAVVVAGINSIYNPYNNIKVYPIPSKGIVNIEIPTGIQDASLFIFDELGNIVWAQNINKINKDDILSIDMGQLPNGVYIARIINGKGVAVKKIVIQK